MKEYRNCITWFLCGLSSSTILFIRNDVNAFPPRANTCARTIAWTSPMKTWINWFNPPFCNGKSSYNTPALCISTYIPIYNIRSWRRFSIACSQLCTNILKHFHDKFTQCPATYCNYISLQLRNIKHFPCWYTVISTRMKTGKTRNCAETRRPQGGVFSHNFEFFQL